MKLRKGQPITMLITSITCCAEPSPVAEAHRAALAIGTRASFYSSTVHVPGFSSPVFPAWPNSKGQRGTHTTKSLVFSNFPAIGGRRRCRDDASSLPSQRTGSSSRSGVERTHGLRGYL